MTTVEEEERSIAFHPTLLSITGPANIQLYDYIDRLRIWLHVLGEHFVISKILFCLAIAALTHTRVVNRLISWQDLVKREKTAPRDVAFF